MGKAGGEKDLSFRSCHLWEYGHERPDELEEADWYLYQRYYLRYSDTLTACHLAGDFSESSRTAIPQSRKKWEIEGNGRVFLHVGHAFDLQVVIT